MRRAFTGGSYADSVALEPVWLKSASYEMQEAAEAAAATPTILGSVGR